MNKCRASCIEDDVRLPIAMYPLEENSDFGTSGSKFEVHV